VNVKHSPIGADNKSTLQVYNDSAAPISVEVLPARIALNEAGNIASEPANGKFLIFPPIVCRHRLGGAHRLDG
jgi:hypothetical protein